MKKYLSYILCLFAGVLLIIGLRGASAANQADFPSSNVIPNVGGLNVSGGAKIQGMLEAKDITASGDIDMSGDLQVSKTVEAGGELRAMGGITNPNGDVKINDGLDIQGTIKNSNGGISIIDFDGVKINGPTTILKGPLDLQGIDIINTAKQPASAGGGDQPVYIKDSLHLIGGNPSNLSVAGDISGINIFSSGTTTVSGVLRARSNIKNDTGTDVVIDDSLKVTGDTNTASIQVSGKALFSGDTEFSKTLLVPGGIENSAGDVLINDALDVRQGIFNNDGTSLIKFGSGNKPTKLSVTGKATFNNGAELNGDIDIKGNIQNSTPKISKGLTEPVKINDDLNVTGELIVDNISTFNKDVTVNGNLKATKIGKYTEIKSSKSEVAANGGIKQVTATCADGVAVSCGFNGYNALDDATKTKTPESDDLVLAAMRLVPDDKSCTVKVKNTATVKKWVRAFAVCFDPTAN